MPSFAGLAVKSIIENALFASFGVVIALVAGIGLGLVALVDH